MAKRPFRVGVLAPMPMELRAFVKAAGLSGGDEGGQTIHTGRCGGNDVVAMTTGMGTENAARATERLLDLFDVARVLVVGIAGGVDPGLKIAEVIAPEAVIHAATGAEVHPATPAGVAVRGKLWTSDAFGVGPDLRAKFEADNVIAVDMETSAVGLVCEARDIPWTAVRAISDRVDEVPDDVINLAHPDGSPNFAASAKYLARNPGKIPQLMKMAKESAAAAKAAARAATKECERA